MYAAQLHLSRIAQIVCTACFPAGYAIEFRIINMAM